MNFLNKYLLVICFSFIYSFQGIFIDDNKNHLAFSGNYATETGTEGKTTLFGGTACYIIDGYSSRPKGGTLELEIHIAKGSFDHDTDNYYDTDQNVIGAVGYYYIKSRLSPVDLILGAGYQTFSPDAKYLDDDDIELTVTRMSYGGGAYKTVAQGTIAEKFDYQIAPFVGFFTGKPKVYVNGVEVEVPDGEDNRVNQLTIGLGIKIGPLTITPTMTSIDGNNDFNVSAGFIL